MKLLLSVFLSLFALPAIAAPIQFNIIPAESSIRFEAKQGTGPIKGQFQNFSADISFSPDDLAASKVSVVVDTGSIIIDDADAQGMITKDEWLNPTAFPNATFATESFTSLGDKKYSASGKLTMKGITLPVVLNFTLDEYSADAAKITGEATLKRRDFKIGWDDVASVNDVVKVLVSLKVMAK